jgi:hypothetical protein
MIGLTVARWVFRRPWRMVLVRLALLAAVMLLAARLTGR